MTGRNRKLFRGIVKSAAIAGFIVLAACSSSDDKDADFAVDDIVPPDALYNQALANLDSGDLKTAQKRLDDLNRQHPYSEYSRRSLILDTFINYRKGIDKGLLKHYADERFVRL